LGGVQAGGLVVFDYLRRMLLSPRACCRPLPLGRYERHMPQHYGMLRKRQGGPTERAACPSRSGPCPQLQEGPCSCHLWGSSSP
jgi:hypothetical protein